MSSKSFSFSNFIPFFIFSSRSLSTHRFTHFKIYKIIKIIIKMDKKSQNSIKNVSKRKLKAKGKSMLKDP